MLDNLQQVEPMLYACQSLAGGIMLVTSQLQALVPALSTMLVLLDVARWVGVSLM